MSHEVETMFYNGANGKTWHGLGKEVAGLQTAEEAIKAAGLDWEVEMLPIFVRNGKYVEVPDKMAIARKTDHKVYGVSGKRYEPIQNNQAFTFFDNVVGTGKACYESAGSLKEGSRVWILANIKGSLDVAGDEIKKYLLLVNSHDGTLALQMLFTPVRVVCWNTMQAALSGIDTARFYSRHTKGATSRIEAAQEILGLAKNHLDEWQKQAQYLATKALPAGEIPKLLVASFGLKKVDEVIKDLPTYTMKQFEQVKELIYVGKGNDTKKVRGTAWQAFNGIAEYVDYQKPYRGGTPESRFNGMMLGSGATMKERAWNYLMKY